MIGKTISHYRILEELGRGGMGVVYKTHDTKLDRDVALKFLPPELTRDTDAKTRFILEAQTASSLDHPNICTIYEIGTTEDNQLFIAIAFYDGGTLKEKIAQGPLPVKQATEIAIQVAQGLQKAHQRGIVHRDIKPANIFLTKDGIVKILDFGLAKLKGSAKLTRSGSTIGTAAYMSPEQARGEEIDQRSDIFSFGTFFYELLTGKLPFRGEHEAALVYSIVNETPTPDSSIPSQIQRIIDRCLQKDKEKRFQHAGEIIDEIRKAQLGTVTTIPGIKRSRWILAGLLFIIALVVLYVVMVRTPQVAERKSIAVLPFTDLSPEKDQEYFCDGMSEEIINALTKIPSLYVASRTSAFQFKRKDADIRTIGEQLNVATILEGSIRKSGTNLRITAQLINVADGYHLWSETYNRTLDDVFSIQENISRFIVNALKLKLTVSENERLVKQYTDNLEAYTLYLRGRYYWNMRREDAIRKSIVYFNQALEHDPQYALAYSGIADAYTVLADWGFIPTVEGYPKGYSAAKQALEFDSSLAEAIATTAYIKYAYERDYPEAEVLFKKAIGLNSNYATAHQWYSEFLAALGRTDEALTEVKKASMLDPTSLMISTLEGGIYYVSRQYNKAIMQFKKVIDADSNFYPAYVYFLLSYYELDDFKNMASAHHKLAVFEGADAHDLAILDSAYVREDVQGICRWQINWYKEMSKSRYVSTDRIALFYAILGQRDSALQWLSVTLEKGGPLLYTLYSWPVWDKLRDDPRYEVLLRRMKFLN